MVARDSLIVLIARLVIFGVSFIVNILLARFLGASGVGRWSVINTFLFFIVMLCGPGILFANVYYIAQKKHTVGQAWASTLLLGIGFGILGILAGISLILIKFRSLADIQDKRLILLILLAIPLMYISAWGGGIIQGMDRISLMSVLEVIPQGVYLVLMIIFVGVLKLKLWGVVIAYISMYFFGAIALAIALKAFIHPGEFSLSWGVFRSNVSYGLKMYLGKLSNWANNRIDILIAPLFLNSAQIGYYAIAVHVSEKLWMFPESMAKAMFPKVSADANGRPELTAMACRTALLIMLPIALVLVSTGWWLLPLLFGPEFQYSYILMLAILPGSLAFGLSRILTISIAGTNRPATVSFIIGGAAVLNAILNFLLIPRFGVVGCSLASTGSYSFQFLISAWFHCRYHDENLFLLLKIERSDFSLLMEKGKRILLGIIPISMNISKN